MPKINTQVEKQVLLDKMEQDRRELADAISRASVPSPASKGWASTTALAASAVVGWPRFLKKPLRALAAVSLRDRFTEILARRDVIPGVARPSDPDVARLAQLTADLRQAVDQAAAAEEVERIQLELNAQVHRIRELKVKARVQPEPMPPIVVTNPVDDLIHAARPATEPVKAPPPGY